MKTISKIILPSLIAGASLVGCVNQGEFKAPNLGAVDVSLYTEEDRIIQGRAMDVDNDEKVDGVFADGYLFLYKEGYQDHQDFKIHYDPTRSKPLSEIDVKIFSDKLKESNFEEYVKSLEKSE